MTLISAFVSPTVGFFGISDVLVSGPSSGIDPPPLALPLRPLGFRHQFGQRSVLGMLQKSAILGRTLVQWSGTLSVARDLVAAIDRMTHGGGQFITRDELFANCGIAKERLNEINLTYHFIPDAEHIRRWHWNCFVEKKGDSILWYQGSGVPDYFFNTDVNAPTDRPAAEVLLSEAYGRAFSHLITEAHMNKPLDEMFGGWLEFVHKTPDTFIKLPYAIKFWRVNNKNEMIKNDPFLFCWYVGYDLIICRLETTRREGRTGISNQLFRVEDLLARGPRELSCPEPFYDPYVVAHFVLNVDDSRTYGLLTFKDDDAGFQANVGLGGVDLTLSGEFLERLHDPTIGITYDFTMDYRDED